MQLKVIFIICWGSLSTGSSLILLNRFLTCYLSARKLPPSPHPPCGPHQSCRLRKITQSYVYTYFTVSAQLARTQLPTKHRYGSACEFSALAAAELRPILIQFSKVSIENVKITGAG